MSEKLDKVFKNTNKYLTEDKPTYPKLDTDSVSLDDNQLINDLQTLVTESTGIPEEYWNLSESDYYNMIKMRNDKLIKKLKSKYNL